MSHDDDSLESRGYRQYGDGDEEVVEEVEDSRMYEAWRCAYLDMFAVRRLRK
jgi:hypothetical protein